MIPQPHLPAGADLQHWRRYHDPAVLARFDQLCQPHTIESCGLRLNLDVYAHPQPSAPVVVFNHGGGGYSRMFVPLALALVDAGCSVVLPDQAGQGLSEGARGAAPVSVLVQNIVDAAHWTRARWPNSTLILGGGSLGSGLACYAAAAGAPADALFLYNLYLFAPQGDGLALTRMALLARIPGMQRLLALALRLPAALLPGLPIPYRWLGRFEHMIPESDARIYPLWQADPVPMRTISLRFLSSMMNTLPAAPLEANRLPALIINPVRDRMIDPAVTQRNAERLGGTKQIVEIACGHWPADSASIAQIAALAQAWMQAHAGLTRTPPG